MGPSNLLSWAITWGRHHMWSWPIVPSSSPPCLPQLRGHTGAPSHPSRRESTQTNNCSDRRALICSDGAAIAREGRQAVREAGGSAGGGQGAARRSRSPVHSGAPPGVSRRACVLYVSQQGHTVRHVSGPSRHKQMFSGYCCSASLVIVFLQGQPVGQGARLCCGKELWRDGKTECIINQQWLWRLLDTDCPSFSLCSMWLQLLQYKRRSWGITIRTKPLLMVMGSCHFKAVKVFVAQLEHSRVA